MFDRSAGLTYQSEGLTLSQKQLFAELNRIDLLVQQAVRRWQLAGQDPDDRLRGLRIKAAEAAALAAQPLGGNWGQMAEIDAQEAEQVAEFLAVAEQQIQALQTVADEAELITLLTYLQWVFSLDRFELDAFLICLAPILDRRYERLYGFLQDDVTQKRATVNLIFNLLDPSAGPERLLLLPYFSTESPLIKHHLLQPTPPHTTTETELLGQILVPDKTIVAWLLGSYEPRPEFEGHVELSRPVDNTLDRLLATEFEAKAAYILTVQPLLILFGPDRVSQEASARHLASQGERLLLTIDLAVVIQNGLAPLQAVRLALRDARLTGAIPCLQGWDACLVEGAVPPIILRELVAYPDLVVICGRQRWQPQGLDRDRNFLLGRGHPAGLSAASSIMDCVGPAGRP